MRVVKAKLRVMKGFEGVKAKLRVVKGKLKGPNEGWNNHSLWTIIFETTTTIQK